MTKDEMIEDDSPPSMTRYMLGIMAWSLLVTAFLMAGIFAIVSIEWLEESGGILSWLLTIGLFLAAFAIAVIAWRTMPDFTMGEPDTPRGKRIKWLLVGIVIVGAVIALPLIVADAASDEKLTLWSNGPVPGLAAGLMMAMWGLAMPVLIVFGRKNADEHALKAGDFSMALGGQIFTYATPIWWMGWRGGFLPQPDIMQMFVAVLVIVTFANLWKRVNG